MKSSIVLLVLMVLLVTVSLTSTTKAQANAITKTLTPNATNFNQGDKFTATLSVSVTDKFTYKLKITDKVIYPAMEILSASYTVTGGLVNPVLNNQSDIVEFTGDIIPPVSVTVTYQAVCCMAGSFYLPPAKLSVFTTSWTDFWAGSYRPLNIISNAEINLTNLLNGLTVKVTGIDNKIGPLDGKITSVIGDVTTIKTDIGTLKGTIQTIHDNTVTIKTDVGTFKVQISDQIQNNAAAIQKNGEAIQNNTDELSGLGKLVDVWGHFLEADLSGLVQQSVTSSQVAAVIAIIAAIGSWVAAVVVTRKKTAAQ